MRTVTLLFLITFSVSLYGVSHEEEELFFKADSIYNHLSEKEINNHFVWVKLNERTGTQSLPPVGGIYLTEHRPDIIQALHAHQAVAVQTDESFNPFNEIKELPSLRSLSSIRDKYVLTSYLHYLKILAKNKGIDHLVLPDKRKYVYLVDFINELHELDPVFFLPYESLVFDPPYKRKEFYPILDKSKTLIINWNEVDEYNKAFRKGPKKYTPNKTVLIEHISYLLQKPEDLPNIKPLLHEIWLKSVTIYEKKGNRTGVIPVRGDSIAVWVSDENSELIEQIRKYYPVVLNLKYDRIPENIPVLIDSRYNLFQASEYAYTLQELNPIIWLCSPSTVINVNAQAYIYTPETQTQHDEIISDMIYGAESISGKNITPMPPFFADYTINTIPSQQVIGFGNPEWLGMDPRILDSIDFVVEEMIREYAAPGCQVLVAKDGKIVFDRAYGYLTYDSLIEVAPHTIYDLASLTKVSTTLLAIMKLVDKGIIHPDSTVATYLNDFRETNKQHITIRQLLVHQAGLQSYIPFWKRTLDIEGMEAFYYRSPNAEENDKRSYGYQPHPVMKDSLLSWIRHSDVDAQPNYRYSDIGFMILHQVIEEVTGQSLEEYVLNEFYHPLALERTYFNPLQKGFELYHIAPTEYDYYFREEQVWGNVHDRNATILGGVAGHAGLFSNAKELAIIMQMIVQKGQYGGKDFLSKEVIDSFNQYQFKGNRRGLGWDKPGVYNPTISEYASDTSFGHTGFTGTMVWADPDEQLIYIFLSNRIFPDSNNWKINRLDTRRKIHDIIYKSLTSY